MTRIAYYDADIHDFLAADEAAILGTLTLCHGFALEHQQKHAWKQQIQILRSLLPPTIIGRIYFEFSIPRMGKRVDVIIVAKGVVFVIEFKVGAHTFDSYAVAQVHDYALDLKNFHRGTHHLPVVPILIQTMAPLQPVKALQWAPDKVADPLCIAPADQPPAP